MLKAVVAQIIVTSKLADEIKIVLAAVAFNVIE